MLIWTLIWLFILCWLGRFLPVQQRHLDRILGQEPKSKFMPADQNFYLYHWDLSLNFWVFNSIHWPANLNHIRYSTYRKVQNYHRHGRSVSSMTKTVYKFAECGNNIRGLQLLWEMGHGVSTIDITRYSLQCSPNVAQTLVLVAPIKRQHALQ